MANETKTLSAASAVVRNPLSVIAMFVLLVEAISTVTLVQIAEKQLIAIPLVYFIVIFPTLVAFLFFGTLWWRHQFLYSPMEYRSDESFLTAMDRLKRVEAKQEAADLNPLTPDEERSIAVVDRLLKLGDLRTAVKVGRTFLEAKQYDIACRIFKYILESAPIDHEDRYNALANLAYAEIGKSEYADAIENMKKSISIAGSERIGPWHHIALAYAYYKTSENRTDINYENFEKSLKAAKQLKWYNYNRNFFKGLYPEISEYI